MATTPAPGIVTTGDLGTEFDIGRQDPQLITLKLGRGLYQGRDGTIHAVLSDPGLTTIDWVWLAFSWAIAITGGLIIGRFVGQWGNRAWLVLAIVVVFIAGWIAHYVWHHRRRRTRRTS